MESNPAGTGVVIELDYALLEGAGLLYGTMAGFLSSIDEKFEFDEIYQARYFSGKALGEAFAAYFKKYASRKNPLKAELKFRQTASSVFTNAIAGFTGDFFFEFCNYLAEKGIAVNLATCADVESQAVKSFASRFSADLSRITHCSFDSYGGLTKAQFKNCVKAIGARPECVVAAVGSSSSAKNVLSYFSTPVVVSNGRLASQDFGGVRIFVDRLDAAAAKKIIEVLEK